MHDVLAMTRLGEGEAQGGWYALYTRHQHEKTVEDLLTRKGFTTFLPLYAAARRWKDRNKILSLPLYPNYVFLHGGLDRRLAILTTPGVIGVVGFAGRASAIPNAEIEVIRRVIDNRLNVEPYPFMKCGDWVRVKSGPLEGIEGILVRKKNLYRLVLSVELLQKSVSVEVDALAVERTARCNLPSLVPTVRGPALLAC
jgi:transcription termination/antitermination protein NusG